MFIYGLGLSVATTNARIIDRIGKARTLIVALIGPAALMLILPHLGENIPFLLGLLLVWGVLQGAGLTTTSTLAGGLSDHLRGRISALASCAGYLGMTFGSSTMGDVFMHSGYVAVGAACAVCATCAATIFYWRFIARSDLANSSVSSRRRIVHHLRSDERSWRRFPHLLPLPFRDSGLAPSRIASAPRQVAP